MEIGTEIIKCIESIVGCICGGVRIGFGPCDECKLILLFGHIMSFISIHRQWLWFVPLDVRQQPLVCYDQACPQTLPLRSPLCLLQSQTLDLVVHRHFVNVSVFTTIARCVCFIGLH
eukprot:508271_1